MSSRHVLGGLALVGAVALAVGCTVEATPGDGPNAPGFGGTPGAAGTPGGGGASSLPGAGTTGVNPGAGTTGVNPGAGTTGVNPGGGQGAGGQGLGGANAGGVNAGGMSGGGAGGQPVGGPYTVPRGMSSGCNKVNGVDQPGTYTSHDIDVTGVDPYWTSGDKKPYAGQAPYTFTHRAYSIRLPTGYDPAKKYPLVFQGGGCGNTDGTSGKTGATKMIPNSAGADGIAVGLSYVYPDGAGACFADEYANTYEIPYLDAVYKAVTENNCVDLEKVFIGGYSSGAWMAYTASFARGGMIRGMGAGAGGIREMRPTPSDVPFAAMMITGVDDTGNPIHKTKNGTTCAGTEAEGCWGGKIICGTAGATDCYDTGSAHARDEILKRNGCIGTATEQYAQWPECKKYTGCPAAFPVVYCMVPGGHTDGGERLNPGVWEFWKTLPPVP